MSPGAPRTALKLVAKLVYCRRAGTRPARPAAERPPESAGDPGRSLQLLREARPPDFRAVAVGSSNSAWAVPKPLQRDSATSFCQAVGLIVRPVFCPLFELVSFRSLSRV